MNQQVSDQTLGRRKEEEETALERYRKYYRIDLGLPVPQTESV